MEFSNLGINYYASKISKAFRNHLVKCYPDFDELDYLVLVPWKQKSPNDRHHFVLPRGLYLKFLNHAKKIEIDSSLEKVFASLQIASENWVMPIGKIETLDSCIFVSLKAVHLNNSVLNCILKEQLSFVKPFQQTICKKKPIVMISYLNQMSFARTILTSSVYLKSLEFTSEYLPECFYVKDLGSEDFHLEKVWNNFSSNKSFFTCHNYDTSKLIFFLEEYKFLSHEIVDERSIMKFVFHSDFVCDFSQTILDYCFLVGKSFLISKSILNIFVNIVEKLNSLKPDEVVYLLGVCCNSDNHIFKRKIFAALIISFHVLNIESCNKLKICKLCNIITNSLKLKVLNHEKVHFHDCNYSYQRLIETYHCNVSESFQIKYEDDSWLELVQPIASSVIKLDFLSVSLNSVLKIDPNKQVSSKDACFILYNYSRLQQILNKFDKFVEDGTYPLLPTFDKIDFSLLKTDSELQLIEHLWKSFDVLTAYCKNFDEKDILNLDTFKPLTLVLNLKRLTNCFNQFYRHCHVLGENMKNMHPTMFARIYLLKATKLLFQKLFSFLLITPVEQM